MGFGEDLIQCIFSWLPAKTIYRFRKLCKSLSEIPTQKFFASNQAQNLQLKDDSGFFMYNNELEFQPLPGKELCSGLPLNSLRFLRTKRVLASNYGLIVYHNKSTSPNKELFICNPAVQTWKAIPTPQDQSDDDHMHGQFVLECDPIAYPKDYMLLYIKESKEWEDTCYCECKIYSPKEGIWKEKEKIYKGQRKICFDMPVYLNGILHFVSDCGPYIRKGLFYRPYIVAYDINNGASRMLRVPKAARKGSHDNSCKMGIFKWGSKENTSYQSICLVRLKKNVFTTWVLADYDSELWVRIIKIRIKAMNLAEHNPINVAGFTVMNGNSLIFATEKNVYRYALNCDAYGETTKICEHKYGRRHVCFLSYSNTLHPLGLGAAPLPDV